MKRTVESRREILQLTPLAVCVVAFFGPVGIALARPAASTVASPTAVAAHGQRMPERGADFAFRNVVPTTDGPDSQRVPQSLPVTSCADDGSPGTLRAVVADALDGDTVDLGALTCSTITLAQGAITTALDNLQIAGPGLEALTIDGAHAGRVLVLTGVGTLAISDISIVDGYLAGDLNGGCVRSYGSISLTRTSISGCEIAAVGYAAGGGAAARANLTMIDSAVAGNTVSASGNYYGYLYGGGVNAVGDIVISGSTISGNAQRFTGTVTPYSIAYGGGLCGRSNITVTQSTIDGNAGANFGGGVFIAGSVDTFTRLTIVDSTVSGNAASDAGGGVSVGGQFKTYLDSFVLHNSTVAANSSAGSGGGLRFRDYTLVDLQSSIVATNVAASGADVSADDTVTIYGANNLVDLTDAAIALPADTLHGDPLLQPLADNGGPTRTQALGPGSVAIDAGNNYFDLPFDQRGEGFVRVAGGRADIGAWESTPTAPLDRIFADGFEGADAVP